MENRDRYVFPVVLYKSKDRVKAHYPDFAIFVEGINYFDALESAKKALGEQLVVMEEDGNLIPDPTPFEKVDLSDFDILTAKPVVTMVEINMALFRNTREIEYVRKNLTLPKWLAELAHEKNVNFSKLLAETLCDILGIPEMKRKL